MRTKEELTKQDVYIGNTLDGEIEDYFKTFGRWGKYGEEWDELPDNE